MASKKPLMFDLFCGLGGWTEAFIEEGYHCIGFDIEAHDYGNGGYPGELVLLDVRSISGPELVKQYSIPACIVASPPCQEYSYMAMPWNRGKQIRQALLGKGEFPENYKGSRTIVELTDLFNQCFRIQREVSAAAGHYVPMVVENVRGAQEWVGRSRWNFGSFHLWGDVPALMPIPHRHRKTPEGSRDPTRKNYNPVHARQTGKAMNIACAYDELKRSISTKGYSGRLVDSKVSGMYSGRFRSRKEASAIIAKIPFPLAAWLAKCYYPRHEKISSH